MQEAQQKGWCTGIFHICGDRRLSSYINPEIYGDFVQRIIKI